MRFILRLTVFTLVLCAVPVFGFAQNLDFPKPREEKLLNDLKLLVWNQPNAEKITVILRIHSGSAFDPDQKMGTVALLSDILFPDEGIKDFFKTDLEGSLDISYGYDYIQITAVSKPGELLTILETLSPAVIDPAINKETTEKVKTKRLALLNQLENDPKYIAERSAAKQLYGDFPYGRPVEGTIESLGLIDFADIIFAKQRLLTSDNATMTISGDVSSTFAYRAVRRLFGGWTKRTEKIPSMFRLPEKPDTRFVSIPNRGIDTVELANAAATVSRKDDSYFASRILEKIMQSRLEKQLATGKNFAVQNSHLLRGIFFIGASFDPDTASEESTVDLFKTILSEKIGASEFEAAKTAVVNEFRTTDPAILWLDVDTFQLQSASDEAARLSRVTLSDVQKTASDMLNAPHTSVNVVPERSEAQIVEKKSVTDAPVDQDKDPKDPQ
ncbi:MAG: insulinase family protein [Pyrinomonadaceae bacterium]